jgi:hypothetical protein
MEKSEKSYIPKEVSKEVPKESLKHLEMFYKLLDVLKDVSDIKHMSIHKIKEDSNREHFKVFGQRASDLKHQLDIFLPSYIEELKEDSKKGSHGERFASRKVIDQFLANLESK